MPQRGSKTRHPWSALLLLPFVGVVSVIAYSHLDPAAWGIPHFFQFVCILLGTTALTAAAYRKTEPRCTAIHPRGPTKLRP